MVGLIKQRIAESENAAVALVFDDKLVVLNEDNDKFFMVDYEVKDKALTLNNWEPIELVPDNDTRLEELSEKFFDPSNETEITVRDLTESFKLKFANEPVKELVNRAAIEKKSIVESNSRIKALMEVRKTRGLVTDDITDIMEDPKIKSLFSKISEDAPVQGSITSIDFKTPLSVSIFEETSDKVINLSEKKKNKQRSGNVKAKVMNMWKSESFKEDLKNMIEEMAEADDAKAVLDQFVNQHVEILILEETELEDLILKTALIVGQANKSDSLVELFKEHYNLEETKKARTEFIERNKLEEQEAEEAPEEEPAPEEAPEKEEKDKETSIDEDSINKILKVMNKIKGNLEEKTMESRYVDSFISALEDAKVGSIGEGKLKEILDFLNSIYEQAQEEKESEEE
jgi:hypothetical protein